MGIERGGAGYMFDLFCFLIETIIYFKLFVACILMILPQRIIIFL